MRKIFLTDEDFIELIARDDEKALNVFYKLHFPMVLNFILKNNGTVNEAKDIYQETIIVFYNKIMSHEFRLESKLKTYIYSVSRRLWLNRLKEKSRFTSEISDFSDFIPIKELDENKFAEDELKFAAISEGLEKIGEPCKTILNDFYIGQKSITDLALKMGYSNADTAKNQKYKCLQRLKKIFFDLYKNENQ